MKCAICQYSLEQASETVGYYSRCNVIKFSSDIFMVRFYSRGLTTFFTFFKKRVDIKPKMCGRSRY